MLFATQPSCQAWILIFCSEEHRPPSHYFELSNVIVRKCQTLRKTGISTRSLMETGAPIQSGLQEKTELVIHLGRRDRNTFQVQEGHLDPSHRHRGRFGASTPCLASACASPAVGGSLGLLHAHSTIIPVPAFPSLLSAHLQDRI